MFVSKGVFLEVGNVRTKTNNRMEKSADRIGRIQNMVGQGKIKRFPFHEGDGQFFLEIFVVQGRSAGRGRRLTETGKKNR